jgi:hypothetical protein
LCQIMSRLHSQPFGRRLFACSSSLMKQGFVVNSVGEPNWQIFSARGNCAACSQGKGLAGTRRIRFAEAMQVAHATLNVAFVGNKQRVCTNFRSTWMVRFAWRTLCSRANLCRLVATCFVDAGSGPEHLERGIDVFGFVVCHSRLVA